MRNWRNGLKCLFLFSPSLFALPAGDELPKVVQEFNTRVHESRAFTETELGHFFQFPFSYEGFDPLKLVGHCRPMRTRKMAADPKSLMPMLVQLQKEMGTLSLAQSGQSPTMFSSSNEKGKGCAHYTQVTLNASQTHLVGVRLWLESLD